MATDPHTKTADKLFDLSDDYRELELRILTGLGITPDMLSTASQEVNTATAKAQRHASRTKLYKLLYGGSGGEE